MQLAKLIKVVMAAGFGPVSQDDMARQAFYLNHLGLPRRPLPENLDYLFCESSQLQGAKHFAIWPLAQAAQSCFSSLV